MNFSGKEFTKLLFTHMFLFIFFVTSLFVKWIHAALSYLQNVEHVWRDLLQEQFPNLHKFSKVQPRLNTFIISSGSKQTSGATGKGISYLVSPSFPLIHRAKCQLLEDQHLMDTFMQLSASDFVSSSEKMIRQLMGDFQIYECLIYSLQYYISASFSIIIWSFYFTLAVKLKKKVYSLLQIIIKRLMQKSN